MANSKEVEVQKFGGTETVGSFVEENAPNAPVKDVQYSLETIETQSNTTLESDIGQGEAAIVRTFEFTANPEAFAQAKPTKQDLFNAHYKGIELSLWKDGLKVMSEVEPRIIVNTDKGSYQIIVGARPMRGQKLEHTPKKLSELVNGKVS